MFQKTLEQGMAGDNVGILHGTPDTFLSPQGTNGIHQLLMNQEPPTFPKKGLNSLELLGR